MPQCKRCGQKGFFLKLHEGGLCLSCYTKDKEAAELVSKRKTDEAQQELQAAKYLYDETINYYKNHTISLENCTVDDLSSAIDAGETFCELLAKWPSTPQISKVFAEDSELYLNFYLNNALGYVNVREDSTVCFDDIRDKVQRNCIHFKNIIDQSKAFNQLLNSIPRGRFPDTRLPLFSSEADVPPMKESNVTKKSKLSTVSNFIALDIETTGLSVVSAEIVEISAIKFVNFEPIEAISSYVKPKRGLDPRAQAINHITEADVCDALFIEEILPAFDAYFSDKVPIVGHNLNFDYNFLFANGSRVMFENLTGDRKFFDTLSLAKREYKDSDKYNLDYLCRTELGIIRDSAHCAFSDALAAGLLFTSICKSRIDQ